MTKDIDQKTGHGKICTKCGEWKLLEEYRKKIDGALGRRSVCKKCQSIIDAKYREENPTKASEWRKNNPERNREGKRKWYAENKDRHVENVKKWTLENPEKKKRYGKTSRERNKEKIKIQQYAWVEKNRDKAREHWRNSSNKKLKTVKGRLENNIRKAIHKGIKEGSKYGRRSFELLGYTVEELVLHIESLFSDAMSWDNYGILGWEIDHIVPMSAHNYETPDDEDFKRCWALSNLRPLWVGENRSKRDKLAKPFQPSLMLRAPANDNTQ